MHVVDVDEKIVLSVTITTAEDITTLTVNGSITHDAAPEFDDELMAILTSGRSVAVDCLSLEYISAPALNALLDAQKYVEKKRRTFYVKNLTDAVKETFEKTGFIDLVDIR